MKWFGGNGVKGDKARSWGPWGTIKRFCTEKCYLPVLFWKENGRKEYCLEETVMTVEEDQSRGNWEIVPR